MLNFQEYWILKNIKCRETGNKLFLCVIKKKKSVKKLNYHFVVLFIFQSGLTTKTLDLFFCRYKRKRNILATKRSSKRGHLLVSNTITQIEMVSEKYLILIASVIHNTVKIRGFLGICANIWYILSDFEGKTLLCFKSRWMQAEVCEKNGKTSER